jgi:hypothetical protein
MELLRTDVLGRECHPYGICSSISPVPSAYALGYPVPPLPDGNSVWKPKDKIQ